MKKTFYVLREATTDHVSARRYRMFNPSSPHSGFGVETVKDATRFDSVADAIRAQSEYAARSGLSVVRRLNIIRVTETPTGPSTTTLREVPLGAKEQTGVAIKSEAYHEYLILRPLDTPRASRTEFLNKATVFTNIEQALLIMQRACRDSGARGCSTIVSASATLVGVAQETVTAPATYDEVVLG